jgi:hypothetical protein
MKWRNDVVCSKCGNKPILWHHKDPLEKSFQIEFRSCWNKSDLEIQTEINKCIPLCKSCHNNHHFNEGKESHLSNNEYNSEYKRQYYQLHREDKIKSVKDYRDKNKDQINEQRRINYAKKKK